MSFTLVIVGRPNVGKSTLFNRLCRKQLAIVDDTPGVTRDWREGEGVLFDQSLRVLDTAGLEDRFDGSMEARMRTQTEAAIKQSDAVLFVIDGREGVTPIDQHFADWLRRLGKPIIVGVNKCDHEKAAMTGLAEGWSLGLGEPIALSAAHSIGFDDLYMVLQPYFATDSDDDDDALAADDTAIDFAALDQIEGNEDFDFAASEDAAKEAEKSIKLAIVGRPNVGKSTLMNALLGQERVMTGPEAGITRDAIAAQWEWGGRKFRLVDTAGLRRRARIVDRLEKMSVDDTLRAIRLAHIAVLMIDAAHGIDAQDLQIARHIVEEGRVLIVALNKWDIVEDRNAARAALRRRLDESLGQLANVPMVSISAQNGSNLDQLMKQALDHYIGWSARASTSKLNRWLAGAISHHPPPLVKGRPNHLRYITQINTRPPTFALWLSHPDELPDSYRRYLISGLRERFDIPPIPVRLLVRKSKNPYADK